MAKDATQQGVSGEEVELTEEEKLHIAEEGRNRANQGRLSRLDELAANVDRERVEKDGMDIDMEEHAAAKEEASGKIDNDDHADTGKTKEGEEKKEVLQEGDDKGKKEPEKKAEPEEEVVIVVDGQETKVPLSKVKEMGIRTLQKESAADKRLEEAGRIKKQAEELLESAKKTPQPSKDKADKDVEDKPQMTADEFKEKKKVILQQMLYGDEEEALKAMDDLFSLGRAQPGSTGGAISEEEREAEVEKVLEKRETRRKERDAAVIRQNWDKKPEEGGFSDLTQSPYLMHAVDELLKEKLAAGKPNSWETYEEIGKEVRAKRDGTFVKEKTTVVDLKTKREKKKETDTVTATGARETGAKQTASTEQESIEDEDRKSAVQDIMKARGQLK